MKELADKLNSNWHSVFVANALVLGLLLLFYEKFPEPIKTGLIPPLVIYTLGSIIIGNIQGVVFRANFDNKNFKEPIWIYSVLYVAWFVSFAAYVILTIRTA